MPGPLPSTQRRRRNAPSIPTTSLPAGGRTGSSPDVPPYIDLREAGCLWWVWAWATPQAAAWALGHEGVVARRASLEDDLAALHKVQGLDFSDMGDMEASDVEFAVRRVTAMATGRLALMKEMRELDDRLGLTPKSMAALRWSVNDESDESAVADDYETLAAVRALHAVS